MFVLFETAETLRPLNPGRGAWHRRLSQPVTRRGGVMCRHAKKSTFALENLAESQWTLWNSPLRGSGQT